MSVVTGGARVPLLADSSLSKNAALAAEGNGFRLSDKNVRPTQASVLRHAGIDAVRPGQNASGQIVDLLESRLAQEVYGLGAANSGAAMRDDLFAGVEFVHAFRKIA